MTRLEKVEQAVSSLSPEEVKEFADWFAEFQAGLWDRQIARDAQDGKFDKLAELALAHHRVGRTKPL